MSEGPVELLLVEDNPADQELTRHALKRHNLANSVNRDGAEAALEFPFGSDPKAGIAEGVPRMILLDLKLPKVSGIEVLADSRAHGRSTFLSSLSRPLARMLTCSAATSWGSTVTSSSQWTSGQFAEAVRQLGLYWLLLNQDAPARPVREGGACAGT
jgi:CheY-like chemotaxis protein